MCPGNHASRLGSYPSVEPTRGKDRRRHGLLRSWVPRIRSHNRSTRTEGLLWHCDRHDIADDLNQLALRIRLANQDPGVATPTQRESCSVMEYRVRISRTFDVEVHVALEGRSDFPVQDEPQLVPNVNKHQIEIERSNRFTLSQTPIGGEGSLGALDSVSNTLITSWSV